MDNLKKRELNSLSISYKSAYSNKSERWRKLNRNKEKRYKEEEEEGEGFLKKCTVNTCVLVLRKVQLLICGDEFFICFYFFQLYLSEEALKV